MPADVSVAHRFRGRFGRDPEGVWRAPGRVNLIGEHTDYNAGWALPFAIDREVVVAAARRRHGLARCWSAHGEGAVQAEIGSLSPRSVSGWAAYPLGVLWAFGQAGVEVGGVDLAVDSTVPLDRGLSSSAALAAAVAVALDDMGQAGLGPRRLAELCHQAEAGFVGVPVGMLDPLAVLYGRRDHGLLIDFRDLAVEPRALTIGPLVVVDTGVRRRVGTGAYDERRLQCREAAAELGVAHLRQATVAQVESRLDGVLRRRARHVVSENERVLEAARRLRVGEDIGDLLWASHASLRDDYAVSCPELDAVVDVAGQAGARGARLTGAGFGGCAIVVGLTAEEMGAALTRRFGPGGPTAFAVTPADGAGRVV
ncbi:MAG: galactokinase [Actinomycetota bacterium]|nr:galactokinase [Actinomycetota bacterium]